MYWNSILQSRKFFRRNRGVRGVIGGVRMKLHVLCFDMPQPEALL